MCDKKSNMLFVIQKKALRLLAIVAIAIPLLVIIDSIQHIEIIKIFQNETLRNAILAIIFIYLIYEIWDSKKLYHYLNYREALRNLENGDETDKITSCNSIVRDINCFIDICKTKIDILKALSPVPIAVLFLGFLIDSQKQNQLSWNIYTITLVAIFLFYAQQLFQSYDNYSTLKRQLADAEELLAKLKNIREH